MLQFILNFDKTEETWKIPLGDLQKTWTRFYPKLTAQDTNAQLNLEHSNKLREGD